MAKILIGVDASERSEDAIAFGRTLALAGGAPVILAATYESDPAAIHLGERPGSHDMRLHAVTEKLLTRLSAQLNDVADVELRPVAAESGAQALQEIAEQEDVGLVVLGSSHTSRLGRVLPGGTAERLLHGAPCPVAVVPKDYRLRTEPDHGSIGCAYVASESGETALRAAEELALALSASLKVLHSIGPEPFPVREDGQQLLKERVAGLDDRIECEPVLCHEDAAHALIERSHGLDVLVIGSRGYGPLQAVLLGGVSGQVIRSAACPVVVIPRGTHATIGSIFAGQVVGGETTT